jgi:hypothetical protein
MLKNPAGMKRVNLQAKLLAISRQDSPASLPDISAGYCLREIVDESGMIQMGTHTIDQKWLPCLGSLV